MHEVSLIQNLLAIATKTARDSGACHIHELRLRVGAMSSVVPEALQFAFEVVRKGTMAEDGCLVIEPVPAGSWCDRCQAEFVILDYSYECPTCHQMCSELRRGMELELASMEVS